MIVLILLLTHRQWRIAKLLALKWSQSSIQISLTLNKLFLYFSTHLHMLIMLRGVTVINLWWLLLQLVTIIVIIIVKIGILILSLLMLLPLIKINILIALLLRLNLDWI